MLSPTILYVEDDDDIRSVVTQVLSSEGFTVQAVSAAEDALRALSVSSFDLLLTDYRLPRENADWLLREATSRDLLAHTHVIVFSAEESPAGVEGYTFLRKPIDLDVLSAAIAKSLSGRVPTRLSSPQLEPTTLVLTLYVTPSSHVSQKAIRNLQRIRGRFAAGALEIVLCDVGQAMAGSSIEEDRIVVTPTLVIRVMGPKVWIAGDLSDGKMVEDVIIRALGAPSSQVDVVLPS